MSDPLARVLDEPMDDAPLFAPPREIHVPARRGHVPIAETSKQAYAQRRRRKGGGDDDELLKLIIEQPRTGDELAELLDRLPHPVSPRHAAGLIERVGATRPTRTGSPAAVWSATAAGLQETGAR
jgi:hypothetical protein